MRESLNDLYPSARRPLIAATDADGTPIVFVGLTNSRTAKVDRASFDRLMSMGISPSWVLNNNGSGSFYVRTKVPVELGFGNTAMLSRLIVPPAIRGVVVRYRDGDRLNLRLDNLIHVEGLTSAHAWETFVYEQSAAGANHSDWQAVAFDCR